MQTLGKLKICTVTINADKAALRRAALHDAPGACEPPQGLGVRPRERRFYWKFKGVSPRAKRDAHRRDGTGAEEGPQCELPEDLCEPSRLCGGNVRIFSVVRSAVALQGAPGGGGRQESKARRTASARVRMS